MKPFYWKLILIAFPNIVFGVAGNLLTDTLKANFGAADWFSTAWPVAVTCSFGIIAAVLIIRAVKSYGWALLADLFGQLHVFIHKARDLFVIQSGSGGICRLEERNAWLLSHHESKVDALLAIVARTFRLLLPHGTEVMVAIRERKSDDSFRTWVRAGYAHPSRAEGSEDFKIDAPVVCGLISSYTNKQDCVIPTGPHDERWIPMFNDHLGQDKSVLMAGIFVKKWNPADGEFHRSESQLRWILCVATNRENQLQERAFKELLKCFNDALAIILNMAVRAKVGECGPEGDIVPFSPQPGGDRSAPKAS
jgi:hypothetical protein